MYHGSRRWCVEPVVSADELADKLVNYSWCGCCGFELEGHLWLNDSTSPDAVQEYAVVKRPAEGSDEFRQVESITVGWCSREELLGYIGWIHQGAAPVALGSGPVVWARSVADLVESLGGVNEPVGVVVHPRIESPGEHGRCPHCA